MRELYIDPLEVAQDSQFPLTRGAAHTHKGAGSFASPSRPTLARSYATAPRLFSVTGAVSGRAFNSGNATASTSSIRLA